MSDQQTPSSSSATRFQQIVSCDCKACKKSDPAGKGQQVPAYIRGAHRKNDRLYVSELSQRGRGGPKLGQSVQSQPSPFALRARGRGLPALQRTRPESLSRGKTWCVSIIIRLHRRNTDTIKAVKCRTTRARRWCHRTCARARTGGLSFPIAYPSRLVVDKAAIASSNYEG